MSEEREQEFVKLLVAHQSLLQAFIVSLLPGYSETDDVVQKTSEVLWRKRDEFEMGTNFKAWALATARFQVMAEQKQMKRQNHAYVTIEANEAIMRAAEAADPEVARHKLNLLNECVDLLRGNDKELVLHRYWQKSELSGYAKATGKSVEALRASLYRIRNGLRKCVQSKVNNREGAV